jgi:outer membrane protein TolC
METSINSKAIPDNPITRWTVRTVVALVLCRTACAQELTLDAAIQLALKSNRSIQNASLEGSKMDDRRASLRSQLLPSTHILGIGAQPVAEFSFTIPRGALGTDSGQGLVPSSDVQFQSPIHPVGVAAVSITQPLSDIFTIHKGLGLIDIQKKLTDEQTRLERQTVVSDVRQLYYGLQSLQGALRAARENVRLCEEVVRVTKEYAEKRQVLEVDNLEAQLHLAKATESVLDLEDQLATLKAKLNQKLGRDVLTGFTIPDIPEAAEAGPAAPQDLAEASRLALVQRPEARQAQLKIDQARAELRIAGAGFNPTVVANFIGVETTSINTFLPRQIGFADISMTWEPFTWGRKKHDLNVHRDELQEAINRQEDAKGLVEIDVAEQYRRLRLAAARLHVASLGRQMAAESLRVAQKQYEVQFSLLKTVLQAQAALASADADYQRTLSELWSARAEYARALGEEP